MNIAKEQKRRALLVLGMHRSGTSAATRVLNLLGAELGDHLIEPGSDNPAGFWENAEAVRINEDLLRGLGRTWYDMREMPDGWMESEAAKTALERANGLVEREFKNARVCAVKDPRMCLVAPLWIAAFQGSGFEVDCLFIVRDPREVVESLHRRNRWPRAPLYLMWVQYLLESTNATASCRRAMVTYAQLLSDWRSNVARVARNLDLHWPTAPDAAAQEIEAFLDPGQRHYTAELKNEAADVTEGLPGFVRALYRICLKIAADTGQWSAITDLRANYREAAELYDAHVDRLLTERWEAEQRAQAAEVRMTERDSIAAIVEDAAQVTREVHALTDLWVGRFDEMMARVEGQHARLSAIEARLQRQHAALGSMGIALEDVSRKFDFAHAKQASQDEKLDRLGAKLDVLDAALQVENKNLQQVVDHANATIAGLVTSTSWKLTAPIRWFSIHVLRRPRPGGP
jgi:hypothetical protein